MSDAASGRMGWDEVWAEYDRRNGIEPLAFTLPSLPPRPQSGPRVQVAPRRPRWRALLGLGAALLLLALAGLAWVPHLAAWHIAGVVAGQDAASLARRLDLGSLQPGIREGLVRAAAADLGSDAATYLADMAEDILEAWQEPGAVAEVMRARGVDAPRPWQKPEPLGLMHYQLAFGRDHAPVTLEIKLQGWLTGPRWQVAAVRLDHAAPVAPTPAAVPLRLSALR